MTAKKKKRVSTSTSTSMSAPSLAPLNDLAGVAKDGGAEVAAVVANNVAVGKEQVAEVLEAQKSRANGVVDRARLQADARVRGSWSQLKTRLDNVVNRISSVLQPN